MFIDSHCHLDRLDLTPYQGELLQALQAARDAGVHHFLCVSIDFSNVQSVLDIALQFEDVDASVGVHPLEKGKQAVSLETLLELAGRPKVVAIGETGLDYHYGADWAELQKQNFVTHVQAAAHCRKPLIIHTREAQQDTLEVLATEADHETGGVMHCFTESWEMARAAMDMNFMISLSGIVTFRNADELRDVARQVPLDRLLIETDAPYLAPVPHRGKANEPKYVADVARFVAGLKGISVEELGRITSDNYHRLFGGSVQASATA